MTIILFIVAVVVVSYAIEMKAKRKLKKYTPEVHRKLYRRNGDN